MALRSLNSIGGFSVGIDPRTEIILANGDITTINFTANGVVDLGNVSNVHISGGTSGQVIQTDGNGNLTFATFSSNRAAPMPYYISAGESYIVNEYFQGLFVQPIEIDGTFEIDGILVDMSGSQLVNAENGQILFDTDGNAVGNTGFTFDSTSGNLAVPGNAQFTGNILPSANITYNLGSSNKRWNDIWLSNSTIYIGNSSISTDGNSLVLTNGEGGFLNVGGNVLTTTIENGNSNITITANGNIVTSVAGVSDVWTVSDIGADLLGILSVTGNAELGAIFTDNYYYANGQPLDVAGNPAGSNTYVQFNDAGEFGASANFTFDSSSQVLTILGNISTLNATLGNAVSANFFTATGGCVTIGIGAIAVSGNSAGIFNATVDDINLGLAANVTIGSNSGLVSARNNLNVAGTITGTYVAGTLTTGAQPNITGVGTLANLSVSGNTNLGNIVVSGVIDAADIKVTDLYSKRSPITVTSNTQIDTFPTSQFRSAKYTMRAGNGSDYQALEVLLVHNNINSIITVYGSLSTSGVDLVTFTTDISAGNVNVYATALGANTNLNLMGTYVPD